MTIDLKKYGPVISNKEVGEEIYNLIKKSLKENKNIIVDLNDIISMATFNAKQIFGKLYLELGPERFFNTIEIKNVNQDLRLIIKLGIESAIG